MNTIPNKQKDGSLPSPFPEGWYFIASRKTIEKEKLLRITWLGEQIVAWGNESGEVCVAEATCPHLGSDLGPEAGGRVRNGCLVCPLHGFEYDVTGQCVATPYAPAPKLARLKVFETREIQGLILAWWSSTGRLPQWEVPEPAADDNDWSSTEFWSIQFVGHPQETAENAVDIAHLRYVHGYDNVNVVESVTVEGSWLKSCFDFRRTQTIAGVKCFEFDISAVVHLHGLGYSFVEIREHTIGMKSRLWVLATPIDGETMDLTIVSQMRKLLRPKRFVVGMRFLPLDLRTWIMRKFIKAGQKNDVLQDVVIWKRKQYRVRPLLCRSDGEIYKYRRYCDQFYPNRTVDVASKVMQE